MNDKYNKNFVFKKNSLDKLLPVNEVEQHNNYDEYIITYTRIEFKREFTLIRKYINYLYYIPSCPEIYYYNPKILALVPTGVATFKITNNNYELSRILISEIKKMELNFEDENYLKNFEELPEILQSNILKECLYLNHDIQYRIFLKLVISYPSLLINFCWLEYCELIKKRLKSDELRLKKIKQSYKIRILPIYCCVPENFMLGSEEYPYLWSTDKFTIIKEALNAKISIKILSTNVKINQVIDFLGYGKIVIDPEYAKSLDFNIFVFYNLEYFSSTDAFNSCIEVGYIMLANYKRELILSDKFDHQQFVELEKKFWIASICISMNNYNDEIKKKTFHRILGNQNEQNEFLEIVNIILDDVNFFQNLKNYDFDNATYMGYASHYSEYILPALIAIKQVKELTYFK